jgi:hypothetical protein
MALSRKAWCPQPERSGVRDPSVINGHVMLMAKGLRQAVYALQMPYFLTISLTIW